MKYLAVLGRLPHLSKAELFAQFPEVETQFERGSNFRNSPPENLLTFDLPDDQVPDLHRLGGTQKLAVLLGDFKAAVSYLEALPVGKITLGVSDYRPHARPFKTQGEALKFKRILSRDGRSVRVLSNKDAALSTATSHHNQLAEKPNHVEIILTKDGYFRLLAVQNITAYAKRDQARPARDAKVGMLPPKLAQILINLCGTLPAGARLLDPFCGTGVVLQEALLNGFAAYGTDLEPRMVNYSQRNLAWFTQEPVFSKHLKTPSYTVEPGDATAFTWQPPIDAVATEAFLGQPMSQPPAEIKLRQEKERCRAILTGFLKNLAPQIRPGTPVTLAVPAWLRPSGQYESLNLLDEAEKLGYNVVKFKSPECSRLLYFREGQVVAREIISLRKK